MNKEQLEKKAEKVLDRYKGKNYTELEKMIDKIESFTEGATKGKDYYQAEISVFYDNPRDKSDIRVVATVDNGKLFSFMRPVSRDFIMTKEGKII